MKTEKNEGETPLFFLLLNACRNAGGLLSTTEVLPFICVYFSYKNIIFPNLNKLYEYNSLTTLPKKCILQLKLKIS